MLFAAAREGTVWVGVQESAFDGSGTPCAFAGLSSFFHPAWGSTGVVLCAPWGFEELATRRSWRRLAESVAAAGYPCLRFDYPGTGNSLGAACDVRSVAEWISAIDAAVDYVRGNAGVRRFVLVGQSLGATLAAAAANVRDDVVGLHLLTPVIDGAAYLRDLAASAHAMADSLGLPRESKTDAPAFADFRLSAELAASLKGLDLRALDRLGVESVVVHDRVDRRESAQAVAHLRRLGVRVDVEPIGPSSDAGTTLFARPLPVEAGRLVARLIDLHPVFASQQPAPARMLPNAIAGETFREQPIRFGPRDALFGVMGRPAEDRPDMPAVVLLGCGDSPHTGLGRRAVDEARALARAGIASLRMDMAGIGESGEAPGRPADAPDAMVPDVRAAVDALAARGHRRIVLAGVSTGATLALAAGSADLRVAAVVAANPPHLVWDPKMSGAARFGASRLALVALLRHPAQIPAALLSLARHALRAAIARVPLRLRAILPRDPAVARVDRLFAGFIARRVRVSLVYAAGDSGLVAFHTCFGPDAAALPGANTSVSILPGADHLMMARDASAWLLEHVMEVARDAPRPAERPAARPLHERRPAVCPT